MQVKYLLADYQPDLKILIEGSRLLVIHTVDGLFENALFIFKN